MEPKTTPNIAVLGLEAMGARMAHPNPA